MRLSRGNGIALGWFRTVKRQLDQGRLVRVPHMTIDLGDSIFVYRPKWAKTNPIAEDFIKTLCGHIKSID